MNPYEPKLSHLFSILNESPNRTNRYEIAWSSVERPQTKGVEKIRCTEKNLRDKVMMQTLRKIAKKNDLSGTEDILFKFRRTD